MNGPQFCSACKKRVEWHVTAAGKQMPIDPEADADGLGLYSFGPGLKLIRSNNPRAGQRTYHCHWDTCEKGTEASKRGLRGIVADMTDQCSKWDCSREDRHFHCFKCGETDHFAQDCPERIE